MYSFNSVSGTRIQTLANTSLPQRNPNTRNAIHSTTARLPGALWVEQYIINVIHMEAAYLSSDISAKSEGFQLNKKEKYFFTIVVVTLSLREHYKAT